MNYMLCKNWKKIIKKTDKLIFKILKKRGGGEIHCRKVKIEPHEIIPQNIKKKRNNGELYTSLFQQNEIMVKSIKFGFFFCITIYGHI